jgi:hypothetical protein
MTRFKLCLASILFAAGVAHAATPPSTETAPSHPIPAEVTVKLDRAQVRAKLAERRAVVLERFLAYRNARVYPVNNLSGGGRRHVWVDDWGNLCAAATLISQDWGRDAAVRIGEKDREIKLASVKTGAVADWILTSGLTHREIVAIQLPGDNLGERMNQQRNIEIARMFTIYQDVERQIRSSDKDSLELATDALMKRPELARALLAGTTAGSGEFGRAATPVAEPAPELPAVN